MAEDVTKIALFGACTVTIDGAECGHVDEKGVKLSVKNEVVKAFAGKFGKVPVREFMNGQPAEVEFDLIQTNFTGLVKFLPLSTKVTSGGVSKLTFGKVAGSPLTGVALKFQSFIAANTPVYDCTIANAVPVGDFELLYTGEKYQVWHCKFDVMIDEAGGTNGNYMFQFGDSTISTDLVAPTVTAVLPVDDAAAVALDTTVTWTISKELDGNTVNTDTVKLIRGLNLDPPVPVEVAGTVVLTNAGAATTIVFTPTAVLTTALNYSPILSSEITDQNGNHLAYHFTDFVTT